MASDTEPIYCLCRQPYDETLFMIECDVCKDWFHGSCVGVLEHQASDIEIYHCPNCQLLKGPLVLKRRKNWHRHDYSEEETGKAVQTGTVVFIKELKNRMFPSADEIPILRLHGSQLTKDYLDKNGFDTPILIEKKDGLSLTVPPSNFTIQDVENHVGSMREIDVIDVARQEDYKMLMREWTEYYNSPNRQKIFNVISLEFSNTKLSEFVVPPAIVRELSWVQNVWPDQLPDDSPYNRPEVQKYCLMGVRDSFTDFHIDFGGTSVWYHVLRGEKVFYLIRPTSANVSLYENWLSSSNQSETFFGDQVDSCYKCVIKTGQTFFVPTGWIHAVFTPIDSLVFGGNFLHSYNASLQLQVYEIERRVKTPEKYLFPFYETICWYAAKHFLDILKDCAEDQKIPRKYFLDGAKALAQHLKSWTQRKDFVKTAKHEVPEYIQYGKILKDIAKELKQFENQKPSPKKPERKRRKKDMPTPKQMVNINLLHQHTQEKLREVQAQHSKNIYNFDEEDEPAPPTLKVRIPKAGAYFDSTLKAAEGKETDGKKGKTKGSKNKEKGKEKQKEKEEEKQKDQEKDEEKLLLPVAGDIKPSSLLGDIGLLTMDKSGSLDDKKEPLTALKLKVSNGKIVSEKGDAQGASTPGKFQRLSASIAARNEKSEKKPKVEKKVKLEVTERKENDGVMDSDEDQLVVDENPKPKRQPGLSTSTTKPGSLKLKLSILGKTSADSDEKPSEEVKLDKNASLKSVLAKGLIPETETEEQQALRLNLPTIRGGLNGSIADILEASGYGTETEFKVDDEIGGAPSPSMRDAIQGMLSMSRMGGVDSLFPGRQGAGSVRRQQHGRGSVDSDEEEKMMSEYYRDDEYVYPTLDLSDEEDITAPNRLKKQERDDTWNPKARVNVGTPKIERPHRIDVMKKSVESGLAQTAAKLSESPVVPQKKVKQKTKPKVEKREPSWIVPQAGSSTEQTGNAFRPGIRRPSTETANPPDSPTKGRSHNEAKKPKKGQATAKQRLGKILKIHKMIF
ncbi:histone lysine demethylase PHF8-like isoform X3 [Haliotis cracherodii]|uniref:histone lysine demethylase PHF8-like isoform X3 n=1 Tax=Haliotis cracherodii TaxID=6455 RepID=UPI0039E81469